MKNIFLFIALCILSLLSLPAYAGPPLGNPIPSGQTAAAAGSIILKSSAGLLYGFDTTAGGSAGYVLIFDSATVPADGAVTPKFCFYLPATSTTGASWQVYPVPFANGITIVFSTTGCFTKTISNTAFITGQIL